MQQVTVTLSNGNTVLVDRDTFVRALSEGEQYFAMGVDDTAAGQTIMDTGFLLKEVIQWELYVAP
jgi:hypothetical protein